MPPAHVLRILDASLNRAGEGLRVVEDYVRFVLDDPLLTVQVKSLRHDLGSLAARVSPADRHASRDTLRDVGTQISTASETVRGTAWEVCAASLKRTEQSLRSIEEYGKLIDAEIAGQVESLRYRLYTLEKAIDAGRSSRERLENVRLCVLVDSFGSDIVFEHWVAKLVEAGVGMIQLRDKEGIDCDLIVLGHLLRKLTRGTATLAIINDRADVAAAVHADGVHLGQEDLSVKDARSIVGTQMLIGVSTHNLAQARAAVLDGANFLGAGPTFPSRTKKFYEFAGLDYLRQAAAEIRLPMFAIGGITAQNLPEVLATGITRVAVGAAVMKSDKPGSAAREILDMLNGPMHTAAEAASPSLAPSPGPSSMLHAIIMAGGTGTRFWPASTSDTPKQLLRLVGDATMLRQTLDRLGDLVPNERRMVVTNERLVTAVRDQLPELPAASVVGEPCKRDTAPCIGLAALLVSRHDPDATLAVMPADHVIRPAAKFQAAVRLAADMVTESPGQIVTFGIKPTYPAEIFGYIHRGEQIRRPGLVAASYVVRRFKEKPDAATAKKYVDSGEYYWNSGIFVWRAATILDALRQQQPEMLKRLETIVAAWDSKDRDAVLAREFAAIKPISIDYAVMEHATDVAVIEAPFEWDDLGGWQSLARLAGTDENGNTILGKHVGLGTGGTIVRGDGEHLIVTLGIKDCIIVHTPNATLVASKHDEEQIRKVVKQLEELGWLEYL